MKIMRGRVRKVLVLFIVGFLIMQVLFNDASTRVKAAHSEMGTIVHINGVRLVREANTNVLSTCFCIAREKICSNDDNVLSDMKLDANKAFLLNNTVLLGFNVKGEAINNISGKQKLEYDKTQNVVWDIIENNFSASTSELHKKVDFTQRAPSYVTEEENVLKWNPETSTFELELINTNVEGNLSANTYVKVDESTLPTGVIAQVSGEKIKFTSTEEFTDVKNIKIYKQLDELGQLVAWSNAGDTRQPQISLDYGEKPLVKIFELKVKTDKKPVIESTDSNSNQEPIENNPSKSDPGKENIEVTDPGKSEASNGNTQVTDPGKSEASNGNTQVTDPGKSEASNGNTEVTDPGKSDPGKENTEVTDSDEKNSVVDETGKDNLGKNVQYKKNSTQKGTIKEKPVKLETKNIAEEGSALDDAPKTGDETPIILAFQLMGASAFTMIGLLVISMIEKRKNRL